METLHSFFFFFIYRHTGLSILFSFTYFFIVFRLLYRDIIFITFLYIFFACLSDLSKKKKKKKKNSIPPYSRGTFLSFFCISFHTFTFENITLRNALFFTILPSIYFTFFSDLKINISFSLIRITFFSLYTLFFQFQSGSILVMQHTSLFHVNCSNHSTIYFQLPSPFLSI